MYLEELLFMLLLDFGTLSLLAYRSLNHAMLLPVGPTLVSGVLAMWSVVALVLKLVPSLALSLKMVGRLVQQTMFKK